MTTEKVTINGTDYVLSAITFQQWEDAFYDSQGNSLRRPRTAFVVEASLKNANAPENPPSEAIPAGHIMKLLPVVLRISDLERKDEGEAPATEGQG